MIRVDIPYLVLYNYVKYMKAKAYDILILNSFTTFMQLRLLEFPNDASLPKTYRNCIIKYLHFHQLEVVFCYGDPELQVGES